MVNRLLTRSIQDSFFLFGARGTGKSTWLEGEFLPNRPHLLIDLLNPDQEETYAKNPSRLLAEIAARPPNDLWVAIDEIQKVPRLLDVVHQALFKRLARFALTGSSARKLKRGRANMLAGRAFVFHLFPFTHLESGEEFDLQNALHWGGLPALRTLPGELDKTRYLRAYAQTYLKEEIIAEQVVRKLDPFRLFLEIAAQHNGEIVNYAGIARDVGVDTVTAQSYFQILADTLVGTLLPAHHRSIRKQQRQNPKFYFFDCGVKRSLDGTIQQPLVRHTYGYGKAFEHFIVLEAVRLNAYFEKDFRLSYLRTKDDAEIDLIVERPDTRPVFIEIKASDRIDERDIRALRSFKKDLKRQIETVCLSQDPSERVIEGVTLLPWRKGLAEIGLGR